MNAVHRLVLVGLQALLLLAVSPGVGFSQGQADQAKITDGQLQAFARAFVKVGKIYEEYESRMKAVDGDDEVRRLHQEGNAKMNAAVMQEGLSVDEYNTIFETARKNEELRDKVNQLITQERER